MFTNVFLHFGFPYFSLFNLIALTKDRNLIPRVELSMIDTSHPLICIFYYFLINCKFLIEQFIVL